MLNVDFLDVFREDDELHLAENVFSGAHKDDIVYPHKNFQRIKENT
jgi:hypothetical protein